MKNKLLLLFFLESCSGPKQNDKLLQNQRIPTDFFQINIENVEENKKIEYLSELASKVDYVQLETNINCIINAHAKFLISDSLIFVNNLFHVLKYSRDGKFLGQMCNYGRGPGENEGITSLSEIPQKKTLAIQSSNKMLLYSIKGEFINSKRTPSVTSTIFTADDRYIAYFAGGLGNELFTFLLTNLNMDTISFVTNHLRWRDNVPSSWMSVYPYFEPFFQNTGRYYVKSVYNDTVYFISKNLIIPTYYINLGKYKLPPEWRVERVMLEEPEKFEMMLKKETESYYCNVFESSNIIFITLVNFRTHKPKYFLVEKESVDNGYMLTNGDKEPAPFINDWDGGIDFWPEGKIDDRHIFMSVKATDLKKKLEQIASNQKDKKLTKTQEKFKKMISEIDISANPVLMIVTLK